MADEEGPSNASWWNLGTNVTSNIGSGAGALWSKAKETGSYVYEFTANDFHEVATALKQDVIATSASALKHKLQPHAQYGTLTDTVANMLGNVSEYLAPQPEHVEYLSRYGEDRIHAIRTSQHTYLQHLTDEHYAEWGSSFTLEEHTHEISQVLVDNQKLRDLHTALVPTHLSYTNFWKIYYYRTELFDLEKKRHEELLERVGKGEEEELRWSDDEEDTEVADTSKSEVAEATSEGYSTENTATPEKLSKEEGSDQTKPDHGSENQDLEPETPKETLKSETCSMSSSAVLSDTNDLKTEGSSEEGSYDVIKHKDLEGQAEKTEPKREDEDFERELDAMIENINIEEPMTDENNQEGQGWEEWD